MMEMDRALNCLLNILNLTDAQLLTGPNLMLSSFLCLKTIEEAGGMTFNDIARTF